MIRRHRCTLRRAVTCLFLLIAFLVIWNGIQNNEIDNYGKSAVVAVSDYHPTERIDDQTTRSLSTTVATQRQLLPDADGDVTGEFVVNLSMSREEAEYNFHEYVSQLETACSHHVRLGSMTDGGWDVCISEEYQLNKPCLVYSFGIGDNWSFDDDFANKFGCTVRSFDPSINNSSHVRGERVWFYRIGIGPRDEYNATNGWTLKTLKSLISMCGDEHKTIDYLKLDVESNEWSVLETMLEDNSLSSVKQLAVEIHTRELNEEKSSLTDIYTYWTLLRRLRSAGFHKWYWHFNTWGFFPNADGSKYLSCCYELVFLNSKYR